MSDNKPYVSILIPVRNEEGILLPCAEAWLGILRELNLAGELLFIDDASHDSTPIMLEKLRETHSNLRFIRSAGRGQHRAVADGIAAARGRLIFFGDADLFPAADDLAKALRLAENGLLAVMRRDFERDALRRAFSLFNNGLLSFLSGRKYRDIGSMQICFRLPAEAPPLEGLYLPLELEALLQRTELPVRLNSLERPSRYRLARLAGLCADELRALGRLPGNRHPHLLSLLNTLGERLRR